MNQAKVVGYVTCKSMDMQQTTSCCKSSKFFVAKARKDGEVWFERRVRRNAGSLQTLGQYHNTLKNPERVGVQAPGEADATMDGSSHSLV